MLSDLPPPLPSFSAALRTLMANHSLTTRQIAIVTGTSANTIYGWTRGTKPRGLALSRLLTRLEETGIPLDDVQALRHAYYGTREGSRSFDAGMTAATPEITSSAGNLAGTSQANSAGVSEFAPTVPTTIGPGPTIRPTACGFDLEINPPPDAERTDASQIALHKRLHRHVARLQAAIVRIQNTHAMLAEEFADYALFLSADLATLDVASLWSVGTGLYEQVRATMAAGPGVMTPELEPDIVAAFHTLLMDHTAFIQGFAVGRELHERVLRVREVADANPTLKAQSISVLHPMTTVPRLLATRAKHMVDALTRALNSAPSSAYELLASGTGLARTGIVAFARVLHPLLIADAAINLTLTFAGQERAEVLQATVIYLRDNMPHVMALYANEPQIANWLMWMMQKIHDIEI